MVRLCRGSLYNTGMLYFDGNTSLLFYGKNAPKNNIKGKIYDAKIIVAISLAYVLIGTVMGVLSGHLFLRLIVMAILAVVLYLNRSRFTQIFVLIKNKRH